MTTAGKVTDPAALATLAALLAPALRRSAEREKAARAATQTDRPGNSTEAVLEVSRDATTTDRPEA